MKRYTYINGSSALGLAVYDNSSAYSFHSTDPANCGHRLNAFDLVRIHKFGNGPDSVKKMLEFARSDQKVSTYMASKDFENDLEAQKIAPANFSPALQSILDSLKKIDFRAAAEAAGNSIDSSPKQKDRLVIAVCEIVRQAWENGSGLAYFNGTYRAYCDDYWPAFEAAEFGAFLTACAIKIGIKPLEAMHFETRKKLLMQFEAEAFRMIPKRDQKKIAINMLNGKLVIRRIRKDRCSITFEDRCREDFMTYKLPFMYDPSATAPTFQHTYLDRVQPDKAAQDILAEFVGNALAPSLKLQKVLVLLGGGNNGKSVFCSIITELLGKENVSCFSMESLTKEESRSRAQLADKLLNYCGENSLRLRAENFKTLVRGEPIECRKLYGESFMIEDYAKIMFNCNELPKDIEQTDGFFRSFLILPFNAKISKEEKNPDLAQQIIDTELPGIFNWILSGLERLMIKARFTECAAAETELENYRKESSSVLSFIEDCDLIPAAPDTKFKRELRGLFMEYQYFCRENGHRYPLSKRRFAAELRKNGFCDTRSNQGIIFFCDSTNDEI